MSSCGVGGQSVISVHCLLKSQRFGRDSRFMLNKIFVALATLVEARRTVVFRALQFVLCTVVTGVSFTLSCLCWEVSRVDCSAVLVWCCAFGPLPRSVMEGGFFHQRLILRTASIAAMLNTTGRMCDSPNGLFWMATCIQSSFESHRRQV